MTLRRAQLRPATIGLMMNAIRDLAGDALQALAFSVAGPGRQDLKPRDSPCA